jgi:hypothetical protein
VLTHDRASLALLSPLQVTHIRSVSCLVSVVRKQVIILSKDDGIVPLVHLVELDPIFLDSISLLLLHSLLLLNPVLVGKLNQELLMVFEAIEHVLVLFDLTPQVLDLGVNFLNFVLLLLPDVHHFLGLSLLLLSGYVVLLNKLH